MADVGIQSATIVGMGRGSLPATFATTAVVSSRRVENGEDIDDHRGPAVTVAELGPLERQERWTST